MKKVLIITYYWPPMGGGGVQRWLKMCRYLKEFGWDPVIFTPENADMVNFDDSLLQEVPEDIRVIRHPIWEPFDLYKRFLGKSKDEKIQPGFLQESKSNKFLQDISVWIRGNIFIPDAKKFWIKPSAKFLVENWKDLHAYCVISTGPPHSNHLIAMELKERLDIPWLADFRDPWTNIDFYDKLKLSKVADRKHHELEKKVLNTADAVVTVSWSWAKDFKNLSGVEPSVVTNGYDPEDFIDLPDRLNNEKLTITHIGSLNADRNPKALWQALKLIKNEDPALLKELKLKFIGPTDVSVFNDLHEIGLQEIYEHVQHEPHKEVVKSICQSDVLLLPLNNTQNVDGVIPGKLYEYIASKRPILCIGKKDGDSAKILTETEAGETFAFNNSEGIKEHLKILIGLYQKGQLTSTTMVAEKYSRRNLAGDIASILDDIS